MKKTTKEIISRDGKSKVQIFLREDGSYGFDAFRFTEEPNEMCWVPHGRHSECVVPDEESAEVEARGRVDWLRRETENG
jgi:hypothetical protein